MELLSDYYEGFVDVFRPVVPEAHLRCEVGLDDDVPDLQYEGVIEEAREQILVVVLEYVLENDHCIVLSKGLEHAAIREGFVFLVFFSVRAERGIKQDGSNRDIKV